MRMPPPSCFTEYLESFMLNIMFRYKHQAFRHPSLIKLMEVSWPEKFSNFQLGSLWRFASRESRLHELSRPTGGGPPWFYRKTIPVGRCFFFIRTTAQAATNEKNPRKLTAKKALKITPFFQRKKNIGTKASCLWVQNVNKMRGGV